MDTTFVSFTKVKIASQFLCHPPFHWQSTLNWHPTLHYGIPACPDSHHISHFQFTPSNGPNEMVAIQCQLFNYFNPYSPFLCSTAMESWQNAKIQNKISLKIINVEYELASEWALNKNKCSMLWDYIFWHYWNVSEMRQLKVSTQLAGW